MIVPVPLPALAAAALIAVLSIGGAGWGGYSHGKFVERAEQTERDKQELQRQVAAARQNAETAFSAGQKFEKDKADVPAKVQWRTRDILIPPDADPFMPVWFVRLFDRVATRGTAPDPYPGLDAGAASDVRLSEVRTKLEAWGSKYESGDIQIGAVRELKPVLPFPESPKRDFLDRVNPANW